MLTAGQDPVCFFSPTVYIELLLSPSFIICILTPSSYSNESVTYCRWDSEDKQQPHWKGPLCIYDLDIWAGRTNHTHWVTTTQSAAACCDQQCRRWVTLSWACCTEWFEAFLCCSRKHINEPCMHTVTISRDSFLVLGNVATEKPP